MTHGVLRFPAKPGYPQVKPGSEGALRLPRVCLNCKALFDSAWAGERVCPRCKATTAWRNGASVAAGTFSPSSSRSGRKGNA